jgi:hypothetical protein
MDEELAYIKRELARLELKLRQDKKMVQACEPETGEGLDDEEDELGSAEDLKHCQEVRVEIPVFQEGNRLRSLQDLSQEFHIVNDKRRISKTSRRATKAFKLQVARLAGLMDRKLSNR